MGGVTQMYSEKIILEVSVRLSFQCLPFSLSKGNSVKCDYFGTGCFVSSPPYIFAT